MSAFAEQALRRILEIEGRVETESDEHEALRVVAEIARKALGLPSGVERGGLRADLFDEGGYYIGDRMMGCREVERPSVA